MFLKPLRLIAVPTFTLLLLWGLGWLWFATSIAFATPEQGKQKTEAIVVLTGGNGRVNEALDLLHQKLAPKLFISGVHKDTTKDDIYKSWKNKSARHPCCVSLGYHANDTLENAQETKEWVEKNKIQTLRLVTSSYHMPRAYLEISKTLPNREIIQHPVFSDDFQPWEGRFWTLTFSEYNKTLVRWLGFNTENQEQGKS